MKKIVGIIVVSFFFTAGFFFYQKQPTLPAVLSFERKLSYWLILHRKSNIEYLYFGTPGEIQNSQLRKKFQVKAGIPSKRPTPLPKLLGRKYWIITDKMEATDNPETAPYF